MSWIEKLSDFVAKIAARWLGRWRNNLMPEISKKFSSFIPRNPNLISD